MAGMWLQGVLRAQHPTPFDGLVVISDSPMQAALANLGHKKRPGGEPGLSR